MKRYLPVLFVLFISTSHPQDFEWVFTHPITVSTNPAYLKSNAVIDNSDNVIYSRLLNTKQIYNLAYFGDNEIIKRNSAGQVIWVKTISGNADISGVVADKLDNIICIGKFRDTLIISPQFTFYSTETFPEGFIFKFDSNGNILWAKSFSQTFQNFYNLTSVETDALNNILATFNNFLTSTVLKLDSDGNIQSSIEQTGVRQINDISIDQNGNLWVAGNTDGFLLRSFNGLDTIPPFSYNKYVVKYSSDGTPQWVIFVEDVTFPESRIVTDNSGNAYWSGDLFVATQFGNIFVNGPEWVYDFFLAKIDPDGNFVWVREIPAGNISGDATVGKAGYLWYGGNDHVYLSGFMRNSLNFGNGVLLNSFGSNDVMVLKYSADGEIIWGINAGGNGLNEGSSITADAKGNCYVSGRVGSNSVFGNINPGGDNFNLFIAKITDEPIPVELISFTGHFINEGIKLHWTTSSEKNNYGFEIERTQNSKWEVIGFAEGNGTTAGQNNYSFTDQDISSGIYKYRLKQIDFDGTFEYSNIIEVEIEIPEKFKLFQNYPNPFNPTTVISWQSPVSSHQTLKVYDLLGREVASLVDEFKPAGSYEVEFDASGLNSGVYYYKLKTDFFTGVKKLMLIK